MEQKAKVSRNGKSTTCKTPTPSEENSEAKAQEWTPNEDELLCILKEDGLQWVEIAKKLSNKDAELCQNRWYKLRPSKEMNGSNNDTWTQEEIALLCEMRGVKVRSWKDIAEKLPGKSVEACQAQGYQNHTHVTERPFSIDDESTTDLATDGILKTIEI